MHPKREIKKQNLLQGGRKAKGSWCARRPFSASTYKRHLYWPQHLGAQDYCQESDMNIIIWCSSDCYWLWVDPYHSETNIFSQLLQAPPILAKTFALFFVKTLVIYLFLVAPPTRWDNNSSFRGQIWLPIILGWDDCYQLSMPEIDLQHSNKI